MGKTKHWPHKVASCHWVCVSLILHHMLGDRLRKGKGEEKDKWLQKWMHSCIYTVRRKAKYSSSSPSCCSILLQGRSPSRDAGWPKDAKKKFINTARPKHVNSFLCCFFLYVSTCFSTATSKETTQLFLFTTYKRMWDFVWVCAFSVNWGPFRRSVWLPAHAEQGDIAPWTPTWESAAPGISGVISIRPPQCHP